MKVSPRHSGFTLVEMLVVIAIIGILAAITVPTLKNMRHADSMLASTRQMLDDVARARQFAISQRATVYMVFCPSNFWQNIPPYLLNQAAFNALNPFPAEKAKAEKLYGKQLSSYTFVTLRSVGEQPGKQSPRYLTRWITLPEGAIIPNWKFQPRNVVKQIPNANYPTTIPQDFFIKGFAITNSIPFPSEDTPSTTRFWLPYIAFNHLGQLTQDGVNLSDEDEFIPVARGGVIYARDQNRIATQASPTVIENPEGNSTNAYTIVHIDRLTGRARLEKQEFAP